MPPPTSNPFADAVYKQLSPVAGLDQQNAWSLLIFIIGISQMFIQFDDIARAEGEHPPWSKLLDINRIPDEGVAWLGQLVGVTVDTSLSVNDQRQQIRDQDNWKRGTVDAIKQAIIRSGGLTGNKSVIIRERDTSPYHFSVLTYPNETVNFFTNKRYLELYNLYPTYDNLLGLNNSYADLYFQLGEKLVNDAILEGKPGGLQYTYTVAFPQDYWAIWQDFASYQVVYNSFGTYQALYDYNSPAYSGSPGSPDVSIYTTYASYEELWQDNQLYDDVLANLNKY